MATSSGRGGGGAGGGGGDRRLYCTEYTGRVRSIDMKTHAVTTIAGSGAGHKSSDASDGVGMECCIFEARNLTFDRSRSRSRSASAAHVKPESVPYFTSAQGRISRLDITTAPVTTCLAPGSHDLGDGWAGWGLARPPSGRLVVSCRSTRSIYTFDPQSGALNCVAGRGGSGPQSGDDPLSAIAAAVVHERCVYVSDVGYQCIRCVTLPQSLFD